MKEVLSRDSFCAPEIEIFKAVRRWAEVNPEADLPSVMSAVRLPLMSLEELLNVVRESGLVSSDVILDGIKVKTTKRDTELLYRGSLSECLGAFPPGNIGFSNAGRERLFFDQILSCRPQINPLGTQIRRL